MKEKHEVSVGSADSSIELLKKDQYYDW